MDVPPADDEYEFYLCLSHDVDRPYKTYQSLYYAVTERRPYHLTTLLPGSNPYWQFERIMAMEASLGVRSTFFFLDEQRLLRDRPVREWVDPRRWMLYAGRYDVTSSAVRAVIERLHREGWEVGLHGSYESFDRPRRLGEEKATIESLLPGRVDGVRQHHLNLETPATWRYQRDAGLRYDATLGSNHDVGFRHGYRPKRPFGDEFVVFPLTVMDSALMGTGATLSDAWDVCSGLLEEAREHTAVMTVNWHQRVFDDREFPGYGELYRSLITTAREAGAWVGPCGDLYERLQEPPL